MPRSPRNSRGRSRSRSSSRSSYSSRSSAHSHSYSSSSSSRSRSPVPETITLSLRNLTRNVHKGHILEIFGKYGQIVRVDMPTDRVSGLPLGRAVVEFERKADGETAKEHMNGGQLDGEAISVDVLQSRRRSRSPSNSARRFRRRRY